MCASSSVLASVGAASVFLGSVSFRFHGMLSGGGGSRGRAPGEDVSYVYPVSYRVR